MKYTLEMIGRHSTQNMKHNRIDMRFRRNYMYFYSRNGNLCFLHCSLVVRDAVE